MCVRLLARVTLFPRSHITLRENLHQAGKELKPKKQPFAYRSTNLLLIASHAPSPLAYHTGETLVVLGQVKRHIRKAQRLLGREEGFASEQGGITWTPRERPSQTASDCVRRPYGAYNVPGVPAWAVGLELTSSSQNIRLAWRYGFGK